MHSDNIHKFHLDYTIIYKVVDPRTLVEHLERDPLKLMRRQIKKILDYYMSFTPWNKIEEINDFRQFCQKALRDTSQLQHESIQKSNFDRIFNYAMEYGIEIIDVDLRRKVVEEFIKGNVNEDKRIIEHSLDLVPKDQKGELSVKDRTTEGKDHFTKAINAAIKDVTQKISGGIGSIEELRRMLIENREFQHLFQLIDLSSTDQITTGFQQKGGINYVEVSKIGNVSYDVPAYMEVDKIHKIYVRIAKKNLPIEILKINQESPVEKIVVGSRMLVDVTESSLPDSNFEIKPLSTHEQSILDEEFTEWTFNVRPLKLGDFSLLIRISTVEIRDEIKKDVATFDIDIKVFGTKKTLAQRIKILIAKNQIGEAVKILMESFKDVEERMIEVVMLSRELAELEHSIRCRLITYENSIVFKNRICHSLLKITKELK